MIRWLGLGPLQVALLFAAAAALIIALYSVRRRPPQLDVPWLAPWLSLARVGGAVPLGRLRRPLALLLALACTLLLALALGDPRAASAPGRSVVVLLDRGAAMAARDEPPSRLSRAQRLIARLADSLAPADRAVLVAFDARATPLCAWTREPELLKRALPGGAAGAQSADLGRGVGRALQLLAGAERPEIVLVSSGALRGVESARQQLARAPGVVTHQLLVGRAARNLGISALAARPYPLDLRHLEVLVSAYNAGPRRERATLRLDAGETPLFQEELWLEPHASVTRNVPDLLSTGEELRARLLPAGAADPLAQDDRARAQLPAPRRIRVLVMSPGNRYLEAALLLEEALAVSFIAPRAPFDPSQFDVAIFDRALPERAGQLPALVLAPFVDSPAQPLPARGAQQRPYIEVWQREHPLLRGLALGDVNIRRAARTAPASADQVLGSSAAGLPLIVEGERQGRRFIALTFDPRESDLPLRPAFPLLVLAALSQLSGAQPAWTPGTAGARQPADMEIAPRTLFAPLDVRGLDARSTLWTRSFPWQLLVLGALLLLACDWLNHQLRSST